MNSPANAGVFQSQVALQFVSIVVASFKDFDYSVSIGVPDGSVLTTVEGFGIDCNVYRICI
jgi:hypothetical protein